ncbi:MAG: nicotinate-nucleotide diphosphorylase (carboxylating) [Candidatus Aquicultor secundus]|uniref:Nicotinate-nucleotide pyrophosphorylase [carboxylating] n=1 Tax=Candidatus Aquicultor secundus TaxID=1973895 RepID=A0A2M7T8B8_9ACTN|nr:carboxylating nicotinate-nucleotide diphosphorylase [Solirubrobacter sp.]OIO85370.1 MAG: nicotinate-nucleotide diphosphorylase (carboxylating) [Candidatus Aquicultor secundus]PIU27158.1 MAG: nicotinate-nucleotide diphosphorylase (carboxylating) [Candidatus Aquicultor secundus]PIW22782.1 MAG: nicotinate-nucleotide diphosphorylase (carboxylating) [Candidatus Aquicultor secundus]PIX51931.1 MAG: nicotinate-nucleotide diphosphorylase (carboxylating) [Candidatus Aquicultor secundus]
MPLRYNTLPDKEIEQAIRIAIEEDFGTSGDVTSKAVIGSGITMHAQMLAKSPGVIAGLTVAEQTFKHLDQNIIFTPLVSEGDFVEAGARIAEVSGDARAVLGAERTALNFVQHLSGIATETRTYKKEIEGYKAQLLDTRKTTPGLRYLEKYAARVGGAVNHRYGLFDQFLIKDNHIKAAGGIGEAVRRARGYNQDLKVEVEAETLDEVKEALEAGADIILLDNMDIILLKESVALIGDKALTEASGGVTLATIAAVAATGVDRISVGAITQAAKPLDISLDVTDGSKADE